MANNVNFGEHRANTLQPRQEPARVAVILVHAGCFIASTAVLTGLELLPGAIAGDSGYMSCVVYIYLMLFLFGIWLIVLGWRVSDNFADYNAVARVSIRVSHIVLVLTFALHQIYGSAISGIFQLDDLLEELQAEANDEANHNTEANTSNSWSGSSGNNGTIDDTSIRIEGENGAEIGPDESSSDSRYASTHSGGDDCIESDAESRLRRDG